jgi:predicted acylesterase/phospholipase RssA/CRP-like cAMP-binding protein
MNQDAHSLFRLHPMSTGLSEDEICEIVDSMQVEKHGPGERVIEPGIVPKRLLLVIGGRFRMSSDARGSDRIANFGPGDQIGFLYLLNEEVSPVAVIADEPSMTLEIVAEALFRLMRKHPLMAKNLLRSVTSGLNDQIVRQRLHRRPRSVTFLRTCQDSNHVVDRVLRRLEQLDEAVGIITDDQSRANGDRVFVTRKRVDGAGEQPIRDQLAKWSGLDRVLFDVDLQCESVLWEQLARLYSFSDQIYLVISPDTALGQTEHLVKVIRQASAWKHKLDVVWSLPSEVQVAPAVEAIYDLTSFDYKIGPQPDCGMDVAIERIIHAVRGVRIGVALGGGAARGMSHYGVLSVLEKANIVIDAFAGTSVGAMLGVTYCSGYDCEYGIKAYTRDLKLPWVYRKIRGGSKWYLVHKFRSGAWEAMLRNYLDDWRLEQLPIPIQTLGVDLVRGEEVIRKRGDAVHAILESINLPYLSAPICRDGQTLVDGGMLNVIPADALVRSGCNYVIAVNVSTKVQPIFAGNRPDTPTEEMKVPNVFQVWSRLLDVQARNLSQMGASSADFTISPDVSKVDIGAFEDTPRIAALGTEAAQNCLANLKLELHQIDAKLFPLESN